MKTTNEMFMILPHILGSNDINIRRGQNPHTNPTNVESRALYFENLLITLVAKKRVTPNVYRKLVA